MRNKADRGFRLRQKNEGTTDGFLQGVTIGIKTPRQALKSCLGKDNPEYASFARPAADGNTSGVRMDNRLGQA